MKFLASGAHKIAIYIAALFCVSVWAGSSQAQPRPPTQKDIDALNALVKKMPTPEQSAQLSKITNNFQGEYGRLKSGIERISREINRAANSPPGFPLTKLHIQAAMINHKKLRDLYVEYLNAVAAWGRDSSRISCVRQADQTRSYAIRVSDQWLKKVAALPLTTWEDRFYALQHVMVGGGDETFQPDSEPTGDTRHWVSTELLGLYAVCGGGKEEYVPGAG